MLLRIRSGYLIPPILQLFYILCLYITLSHLIFFFTYMKQYCIRTKEGRIYRLWEPHPTNIN